VTALEEQGWLAEQFEECARASRAASSRWVEIHGAEAVANRAQSYSRLDLVIRPALVNGAPGVVTTRDGEPLSVGAFIVREGRIVEIDFLADPERLRQLDLTALD
jgi:hypothetical protein